MGYLLIYLMFFLIGCYLLYWVVRLGVRDGVADADERRAKAGSDGRSIDP